MDLRPRTQEGKIKIGVVEIYSNGREDAVRPFDMPGHDRPAWHNHAHHVIEVIRTFVPGAEFHLVPNTREGFEYLRRVGVSIVNVSLQSGALLYHRELAEDVFIFVAAGNESERGEHPLARLEKACAVGAVNEDLTPRSYSSWGHGAVKTVAVTGRKWNIDGREITLPGTSFAAPVCTGLTAQWMPWYKGVTGVDPKPRTTSAFVRQNSHDIWDDGKDLRTGWGLYRLPHRFEASKLIIKPGQRMARRIKYVEGEDPVETSVDLLVPAEVKNDRILIPLRGSTEGLDLTVEWDGVKNQAYVTT